MFHINKSKFKFTKIENIINFLNLKRIYKINYTQHYINLEQGFSIDELICKFESIGFAPIGRAELKPIEFKIPFNWNINPYNDSNWQFQLHAWRMLNPYFYNMNSIENFQENFKKISSIVEDWNFFNKNNHASDFFWYDMSAGIRALLLSCLIQISANHGVNLLKSEFWKNIIDEHIDNLSDEKNLSAGNHGLYQINGLMSLLWLLPKLDKRRKHKKYAVSKIEKFLFSQIGNNGIHEENSPDYHFFIINVIEPLLKSPWWNNLLSAKAKNLITKAELAKHWLVTPDNRPPPIGDSAEYRKPTNPEALSEWPCLQNDTHMAAQLDIYGVIRSQPDIPLTSSSYLMMVAGFHCQSHKHADCLSFVWQEDNEYILIDSGKYGYNNDEMRAYFKSTRAHNTIEIDGKSHSLKKEAATGSLIKKISNFGRVWCLDAEKYHAEYNVSHTRKVIYLPKNTVLALDKIKNNTGKIHKYTNFWHFNPNYSIDTLEESILSLKHKSGKKTIIASTLTTSPERLSSILARGQMHPNILGWFSPTYLKYVPTTTVGYSATTDQTYLVATLFEIVTEGSSPFLKLKLNENNTFHVSGMPSPNTIPDFISEDFSIKFE